MTGRLALMTERNRGKEGSRTQEMPRLIWAIIHFFGILSLILMCTRSYKGRLTESHAERLRITIA